MNSKSAVMCEAVMSYMGVTARTKRYSRLLGEIRESAMWGELPSEVLASVEAIMREVRYGPAMVAFAFKMQKPKRQVEIVCEATEVGPSQVPGFLAAVLSV